ncbi:winged helix-turn-helix domain-containing protein [Serratia fonticola]|uniref:winged helix-turn-helix domain-containing protein n=1 Tax=Serratia fonticola TaxID=47917 RepID=UPI0015C64C99|nr:winged helix-turn-helix domain-containing protein [Serratia fonticola]MBC3381131.1 winged helix-turn-helix domain-containing protein [Serratia fonticola]NYA40330.1 winged helix-turn-helix domain-containing protein [Serratia fonticola]
MKRLVIFNGIVGYNKAQALLYNIDDPEKQVNLYDPTNKCLSLLIDTQPEVISKYVFFERIWEDEGLTITANTFYQHIAMLRRAFEQVGLAQEVIVTIPRKGLALSKEVSLTFEAIHDEVPASSQDDSEVKSITSDSNRDFYHVKLFSSLPYLVLVASVFLGAFFFTQQVNTTKLVPSESLTGFQYLGEVQGCKVSVLSPSITLDEVTTKIKDSGVDCKSYSNVYYSSVPSLKRGSLIACSDNVAVEDKKCLSYFFVASSW